MDNKIITKTQQFEERVIFHLSEICPGMEDYIRIILWEVAERLIQRANKFSFEPNTTAVGSGGFRIRMYLNGPLDESEDGIIRQYLWELLDFCCLSICHHIAELLGVAPFGKIRITALPE